VLGGGVGRVVAGVLGGGVGRVVAGVLDGGVGRVVAGVLGDGIGWVVAGVLDCSGFGDDPPPEGGLDVDVGLGEEGLAPGKGDAMDAADGVGDELPAVGTGFGLSA